MHTLIHLFVLHLCTFDSNWPLFLATSDTGLGLKIASPNVPLFLTTSDAGLGLKMASPNVADPPVRPRSMSSDIPAGIMSRGTDRDLWFDRRPTVLREGEISEFKRDTNDNNINNRRTHIGGQIPLIAKMLDICFLLGPRFYPLLNLRVLFVILGFFLGFVI